MLHFTNYCERGQYGLSEEDFRILIEADGSAEMREYSKIWTITSSVGAAASLYFFGWTASPLLVFPTLSGIFWAGFSKVHQNHEAKANHVLATYLKEKKN